MDEMREVIRRLCYEDRELEEFVKTSQEKSRAGNLASAVAWWFSLHIQWRTFLISGLISV